VIRLSIAISIAMIKTNKMIQTHPAPHSSFRFRLSPPPDFFVG
jgi:hypothetical protein